MTSLPPFDRIVRDVLQPQFRSAGFRRTGYRVYGRVSGDHRQALHVQKHRFGPEFRLNALSLPLERLPEAPTRWEPRMGHAPPHLTTSGHDGWWGYADGVADFAVQFERDWQGLVLPWLDGLASGGLWSPS